IDIGIAGENIKKVGDLTGVSADKVIDAKEKYVCPGFIDLTSHSDTYWTLFAYPSQESLIRQGITTILGGNCGSSLAPLVGEQNLKIMGGQAGALKANINWQSLDEFFSELKRRKIGVNFATLVGLKTLFDSSGEDFKQTQFLLEKSLDEGAFGLSTNLGIMRKNGFFRDRLEDLFKIVAKNGGITKHHLEDESKNILPSVSFLIQKSRISGAPLHISHFKVLGKNSWSFFEAVLNMINNTRKEGIALSVDFFPYERTGSDLFMLLPAWLKRMNRKEIMEILSSGPEKNEKRKEVIEHLKNLTLHYDKIIIASSWHGANDTGKTIMEISELTELNPEEVILNLLKINELHVSIFSEVISMEHIKKLAAEKYSVIASDGAGYDFSIKTKNLPHPRSFGAFPRAMRLFVKESGLLKWEEMIYKMSGLPASIINLKDRGVIAKNNKADIIVFNPEEISDYATYKNPFQYSKGVEYVLINGKIVLSDSLLMGKFAGQVLSRIS
ncbi:MAG TPA: hypothetical protein ENH22_00630, partial [Candidatus Campbellbacteria bacterium]|nr:hypothetical protein [Candidatus Campbellbacteria bacterium]